MKKIIIASSMIIGLFSISALAQQTENPKSNQNQTQNQEQKRQQKRGGGQRGNKKFQEMDVNNDGFISKEEWTRNPKAFERIDTNNDSRISKEEMEYARQQKTQKGEKNSKPKTDTEN